MTQIAVSDELATSLASLAGNRGCTAEELLQSIVSQIAEDDAFAERLLTPAVEARLRRSLEGADQDGVVPSDAVDRRFEEMFRDLESR